MLAAVRLTEERTKPHRCAVL